MGYWGAGWLVWRRIPIPRSRVPAWLTFAWCIVFAAISVYWLLGGRIGVATLAVAIQEAVAANDRGFALVTWATVVLKVLGGVVALATIRPWGRALRRLLLVLVTAGGVLLTLYGVAGFVEKALMLAGVTAIPAGMGEGPARWYLVLWEPWWILGGVLFLLTANVMRERPARLHMKDASTT